MTTIVVALITLCAIATLLLLICPKPSVTNSARIFMAGHVLEFLRIKDLAGVDDLEEAARFYADWEGIDSDTFVEAVNRYLELKDRSTNES